MLDTSQIHAGLGLQRDTIDQPLCTRAPYQAPQVIRLDIPESTTGGAGPRVEGINAGS